MILPWFRLYSEFATDPKIQLLAFEDQRHFVMLLCLKCNGTLGSTAPTDDYRHRMIAKSLGLDSVAAAEAKRRLLEVGLIDETWEPTKWSKRQFSSDISTQRVQAFRARNGRGTGLELGGNGIEEIRRDKKREDKTEERADALVLHASLPKENWEEWLAHRREKQMSMSTRALAKQLKLLSAYPTEVQREIIDTSINAGWRGLFAPKGARGAKLTWTPNPEDCDDEASNA